MLVSRLTGDRRLAQRRDVDEIKVVIRLRTSANEEHIANVKNVSESGVSFETDLRLIVDSSIDVRIKVPAVRALLCEERLYTGRIVRVEPGDSGLLRVGVEFHCYKILDRGRAKDSPEVMSRLIGGPHLLHPSLI